MMEVRRVSSAEYGSVFPTPPNVFDGVEFNELNSWKCEELHYLLFIEGRVRCGIILGLRDGVLHSPFSAPFGGFAFTRRQRMEYVDHAVTALTDYARRCGHRLRITLPPLAYDEEMLSKCVSAFSRLTASDTVIDLSYYCRTDQWKSTMTGGARRALKKTTSCNIDITEIPVTDTNIDRMYSVIKANHDRRGYPVHLTPDEIKATLKIVPADLFMLTVDGRDAAAAMFYSTAPGTAQLIYWGDAAGYGDLRVMNRLADYAMRYYSEKGYSIIDLGPATESGEPNYGLCAFKETIGTIPSLKYTFITRP